MRIPYVVWEGVERGGEEGERTNYVLSEGWLPYPCLRRV